MYYMRSSRSRRRIATDAPPAPPPVPLPVATATLMVNYKYAIKPCRARLSSFSTDGGVSHARAIPAHDMCPCAVVVRCRRANPAGVMCAGILYYNTTTTTIYYNNIVARTFTAMHAAPPPPYNI